MSDPTPADPTMVSGTAPVPAPAVTGRTTTFTIAAVDMLILELEDSLFRSNSAVMMPEAQRIASGSGTPPAPGGIPSLALVFKEFEIDPRLRLLITGHTEHLDTTEHGFELSRLRAENVVYLLIGEEALWAQVCAQKHLIEDCKQILAYFAQKNGWDCNPGDINDQWNDSVQQAIDRFFQQCAPASVADIMTAINGDAQHRWPEQAWRAVFELYNTLLAQAFHVTAAELTALRSSHLVFVNNDPHWLACGESFPIAASDQSHYRSRRNCRVEVLFFQENAIASIPCPVETNRIHSADECFLRDATCIRRSYIDERDRFAIPYHIRMTYFDKIRQAQNDVPEGLPTIRAFLDDGTTEIPTRMIYNQGVYIVVVQFRTQEENTANANTVHFRLECDQQWIFTESNSAAPASRILQRPLNEVTGLTPQERSHYYDLPAAWDSRNWFCSWSNNVKLFSEHMQTRTQVASPIIFNLDDVILIDSGGGQGIADRTGKASAAQPHGRLHSGPAFGDESRVRILFVDPATNKLDIYKTNASGTPQQQHDSSLIRFQAVAPGNRRNLIKDPPPGTRAVVFCGEFYDVTSKRTASGHGFRFADGHVLGARAAIVNDADVHFSESIAYNSAKPVVHCPDIGDFDLHFLFGGGVDNDHFYSYMVIYWSAFVMKDTDPTGGLAAGASAAELDEFKSIGMMNAMKHWNKKEYQLVDHTHTSGHIIRPFFLFEAFEEFSYTPAAAFDFTGNDYKAIFSHADFATALENSWNGVPKTLLFVTEEAKGSWALSTRDAHRPFTLMSLRIATREDDTGRFPGIFPHNEFNDPDGYGCLVMAHEIGHITGQKDDYLEMLPDLDPGTADETSIWAPRFGQFGLTANGRSIEENNSNFGSRINGSDPFSIDHDSITMMNNNGPIRMRHFWRFAQWINSESAPTKHLNRFLNNTQFELAYPRFETDHPAIPFRYFRDSAIKEDPWDIAVSGTLTFAPNREINVYLFKELGETKFQDKGDIDNAAKARYTTIVAARILIVVTFVNNTNAAGAVTDRWNNNQRKDWIEQLYDQFTTPGLLQNRYKIAGGGGAFDPAALFFLPGFEIHTGAGSPGHPYNYHVKVKCNTNDPIVQATKIITIGQNTPINDLFNYFFNKAAGTADITAADLECIKNWYNQPTIGNGTFTIQTL